MTGPTWILKHHPPSGGSPDKLCHSQHYNILLSFVLKLIHWCKTKTRQNKTNKQKIVLFLEKIGRRKSTDFLQVEFNSQYNILYHSPFKWPKSLLWLCWSCILFILTCIFQFSMFEAGNVRKTNWKRN